MAFCLPTPESQARFERRIDTLAAKAGNEANGPRTPPEPPWDAARFVTPFVTESRAPILALVQAATNAGFSERKATRLLTQAEADGLIYRWRFGVTQPVQLATVPQPDRALCVLHAPPPVRARTHARG